MTIKTEKRRLTLQEIKFLILGKFLINYIAKTDEKCSL